MILIASRQISFAFSFFLFWNVYAQSNIGPGNAIQLDGVSSYIDMGDRYNSLTLPVTIEMWVNVNDAQTDWGPVFVSQEGTKSIYYGFWLFVKRDGISV
ncbi:MAG: hypothetical protein OEW75_18400, partial [Cyclobacteriaceae bacterium]|nr:hypothetical protein [Cyclobacteriaceae bacterium]